MALTAATNAKIAPNLTGTSLLADLVLFIWIPLPYDAKSDAY